MWPTVTQRRNENLYFRKNFHQKCEFHSLKLNLIDGQSPQDGSPAASQIPVKKEKTTTKTTGADRALASTSKKSSKRQSSRKRNNLNNVTFSIGGAAGTTNHQSVALKLLLGQNGCPRRIAHLFLSVTLELTVGWKNGAAAGVCDVYKYPADTIFKTTSEM